MGQSFNMLKFRSESGRGQRKKREKGRQEIVLSVEKEDRKEDETPPTTPRSDHKDQGNDSDFVIHFQLVDETWNVFNVSQGSQHVDVHSLDQPAHPETHASFDSVPLPQRTRSRKSSSSSIVQKKASGSKDAQRRCRTPPATTTPAKSLRPSRRSKEVATQSFGLIAQHERESNDWLEHNHGSWEQPQQERPPQKEHSENDIFAANQMYSSTNRDDSGCQNKNSADEDELGDDTKVHPLPTPSSPWSTTSKLAYPIPKKRARNQLPLHGLSKKQRMEADSLQSVDMEKSQKRKRAKNGNFTKLNGRIPTLDEQTTTQPMKLEEGPNLNHGNDEGERQVPPDDQRIKHEDTSSLPSSCGAEDDHLTARQRRRRRCSKPTTTTNEKSTNSVRCSSSASLIQASDTRKESTKYLRAYLPDPNKFYVEETAHVFHNPPIPKQHGELDEYDMEPIEPANLRAIPLPPPLPPFPKGKCIWSWDEKHRVLLADFTKSYDDAGCTLIMDRCDEQYFFQMLERNDVTVISEGLVSTRLIDTNLWSLQTLEQTLGGEYYHKFRRFDSGPLRSPSSSSAEIKEGQGKQYKKYFEQDSMYSMKIRDYVQYLRQRRQVLGTDKATTNISSEFKFVDHNEKEHKIDVAKTALYMIDFDIGKLFPQLYDNFLESMQLKGVLPGGEHCLMHSVRWDRRCRTQS